MDEGAQRTAETMSAQIAEKLLRETLRTLMRKEWINTQDYQGLVYCALTAATRAGYKCGVRVYDMHGEHSDVAAFIALPNGVVGWEIVQDYVQDLIAYNDGRDQRIAEFLGEWVVCHGTTQTGR